MVSSAYRNLVEMQEASCRTFKERPLYGVKRDGKYEWVTYGNFAQMVDECRGGLAKLGVSSGDKVAIISNNSLEWVVAAYATYGLGAQYVAMYTLQQPKEWKYILRDSGAKVVIVENREIFNHIRPLLKSLGSLECIIRLDESRSSSYGFGSLLEQGKRKPVPSASPKSNAPFAILYTSGTTGLPKGVELSHSNVLSNIQGVLPLCDLTVDDRSFAFLPWAHIFGQFAEVHGLIYYGLSAGIVPNLSTPLEDLAEIQPTVIFGMPRFFGRIYDIIQKRLREENGLAANLFNSGLKKASVKNRGGKLSSWDQLTLKLADQLLFKRVKHFLGGRLRYGISGAAALNTTVAEFMDNLGIRIYEGYGLSETSPIVSTNNINAYRVGSVGKVIQGVRVEIDTKVLGRGSEDGEIIVYGPNVMLGYHNQPEATKRVMTRDGGLRTGDLGHFDADGFLYITGRIKEQYKLENGKYVAPGPLERHIRRSPYVTEVMVYGQNKPYNVALILPNKELLQEYALEHGIAAKGDELLEDQQILGLFKREIVHLLSSFHSYEVPRSFKLVQDVWSSENGMLTPALKLKRLVITETYQDTIQRLYEEQP